MRGMNFGRRARGNSTPTLPAWVPAAGQRANINLNSASAVDYDALNPGISDADRWWNGYSQEDSFPGMMGYSGSIWAPGYSDYGALIVKGGGHGYNIGQHCYPFNFSTRQWEQVGAPANFPSSLAWAGWDDYRTTYDVADDLRTYDPPWYDYNHNGSYIKFDEHSYLQSIWISPAEGGASGKGSLILPQTTFAQAPETADARNGISTYWSPHLFNLTSGVLTRAASTPHGAWPGSGYSSTTAVKDTSRDRLWYLVNSTSDSYYYELGSAPFTRVAHRPQKVSGGNIAWTIVKNSTWVYVEDADCMCGFYPANSNEAPPATVNVALGVQILKMDGSGFPVDQERDANVGTYAMPRGGLMVGVAWVPASVVGGVGKFYVYEGYGDTFAYTLTPSSLNFSTCTWTWGRESFSNGHTGADPVYRVAWDAGTGPANAQIYAIMGRWCYVPALGCIALHDGPGTSAQCFDGVTRGGIVQLWRPPGTPI